MHKSYDKLMCIEVLLYSNRNFEKHYNRSRMHVCLVTFESLY